MSEETKQLSIAACAVVIIVSVLTLSLSIYYYNVNHTAMTNGYVQRTLQGKEGVFWTKDDKTPEKR